jgi:FkbM family methyltransferase
MKVISFSLWGDSPVHNVGAVRNAELALDHYPGWSCWFHCSRNVPRDTLDKLRELPNTRIIPVDEDDSYRGLFWRFFPISNPQVEVMLSRDCDSRIDYRESAAVREFLRSDKRFHVLRDHPWHNVPILGGLFGVKRPLLSDIASLLEEAPEYRPDSARLGADQEFLGRVIWPLVKEEALIHDNIHEPGPWPVPRSGMRFVGQAFDENDLPLHPNHAKISPVVPDFSFRIDLREVPLMVVSAPKFRARLEELRLWAAAVGMRSPVVFQDEFGTKYRSNCQNHLSAISALPTPFLVLEDDARTTDSFMPVFDVPCDTSALYLGTSSYGLTGSGVGANAVIAIGSPLMPRVLNMLSLHAVLYLDPTYVASTRKLLHEAIFLSDSPPSDAVVAAQMASWNVCAMTPPYFYQNDGKNDSCTRRPLKVIGSPASLDDKNQSREGLPAIAFPEAQNTEVVRSSYGSILAFKNDYITWQIRKRGEFTEKRLTEIVLHLEKTHGLIPHTMVDIGAHIGTNIIYAHNTKLFEKFIAIEPSPATFEILNFNVMAHIPPEKVLVYNTALGAREGTVTMELNNAGNSGDNRIRNLTAPNGYDNEHSRATTEVPICKAGKLLGNIEPAKTLICIDTQGSEGFIFTGFAEDNINPNFIISEYWPYGLERLGCKSNFLEFIKDFDMFDVNSFAPLTLAQIHSCGAKRHEDHMDVLLVRKI